MPALHSPLKHCPSQLSAVQRLDPSRLSKQVTDEQTGARQVPEDLLKLASPQGRLPPEASASAPFANILRLPSGVLGKVMGKLDFADIWPASRVCRAFAAAVQDHASLQTLTLALDIAPGYGALRRHVYGHAETCVEREVWGRLFSGQGTLHLRGASQEAVRREAEAHVKLLRALGWAVQCAIGGDSDACMLSLNVAITLSGGCNIEHGQLDTAEIESLAHARLIEYQLETLPPAAEAPAEEHRLHRERFAADEPECLAQARLILQRVGMDLPVRGTPDEVHRVCFALLTQMEERSMRRPDDDTGCAIRRQIAARLAETWGAMVPNTVGQAEEAELVNHFMAINAHRRAARLAGNPPLPHVAAAHQALRGKRARLEAFWLQDAVSHMSLAARKVYQEVADGNMLSYPFQPPQGACGHEPFSRLLAARGESESTVIDAHRALELSQRPMPWPQMWEAVATPAYWPS